MKTSKMTPKDMEARLARFKDLTPMASQKNPKIPQEAADMIWARKLMPVITYGDDVPSPFWHGGAHFGGRRHVNHSGGLSAGDGSRPTHASQDS